MHSIDVLLYERYGLTNGEVRVIDPSEQTFGADFELFTQKPGFHMTSDAEIDRIYTEHKERFDKLARAQNNAETDIIGHYDLSSTTKPSKEELEDAFFKWNCAILTAFRGSKTLSKEDNLKRNESRNDELKAKMHGQGLLFRGVDGYYLEIAEEKTEKEKVKVNEFSFFVTNTDEKGTVRMEDEKRKEFFTRIYRLAEHYEQDSFLFTFPGANRVAFLVATNDGGRSDFRNDFRFAGPLFTNIEDLDSWTGCSNDEKIAFILKGMVQKKVPYTKVWIGEGDIFDTEGFRPDCLVVVHDGKHKGLSDQCGKHSEKTPSLFEKRVEKDGLSVEKISTVVTDTLEALPNNMRTVSFHCSACVNGSYVEGAKAAYDAVLAWAGQRNRLTKIVIVDMFGDYCKIC